MEPSPLTPLAILNSYDELSWINNDSVANTWVTSRDMSIGKASSLSALELNDVGANFLVPITLFLIKSTIY